MSETALPSSALASSSANRLALIALLIGGAAIGGSPIFVRLSEVGPMATAFWRVALALLPLLIWSRATANTVTDQRPAGWVDYGLLVLPGVIDTHAHLELEPVVNPKLANRL